MSAVERAADVLARTVDCTWCDAGPSQPCSEWDKPIAHPHQSRHESAVMIAEALAAAGCLRDDREGETVTFTPVVKRDGICEACGVELSADGCCWWCDNGPEPDEDGGGPS